MWLLLVTAFASAQEPSGLRDGDLVFHRSTSAQSRAIAEATGSELTHMGVVLIRDGKEFVLEAGDPVQLTDFDKWVQRGASPTQIKRLREADRVLTPEVVARMHEIGESWLGLRYDALFEWTDARLYCSELAWKLYERSASVRLGEPRALGSYSLEGQAVKTIAAERRPEGLDLTQELIAPQDIYDYNGLVEVDAPIRPR